MSDVALDLRYVCPSMQRMIAVPSLQGVVIARNRSNHISILVPETPQAPTATRMLPEISLSYMLQIILAPIYPTL